MSVHSKRYGENLVFVASILLSFGEFFKGILFANEHPVYKL